MSCVLWANNELVVTCGDDRKLLFWNVSSYHEPVKTIQMPIDAFPTSIHYPSNSNSSSNVESSGFSNFKLDSNNQIALGATNGHFYLFPLNWNGNRLEKDFEGHHGSIIVIRWSNDNSTIATGGEDGVIKIWSRVGMLRSTIIASNLPIYALSWSPDSNSLTYGNNHNVVIKSLSPQSKTIEWPGHEGIIVSIHWSVITALILSAGEDGKVKMWDNTGRLLYSTQHSSALTSVAWSPDGELFAISTFNSIRLHTASGMCLSLEKLSTEGIHTISWSNDSNQLCFGCSNGQVFFAYVVERRVESDVWQAVNVSRRAIRVTNVISDFKELLEFRDSVMRMSFAYDHLVAVTTTQCYIYETSNWSTPHYFDLKNVDVIMIKQCQKLFILVTQFGLNVYAYDGRFLRTIKVPNTKMESLRPNLIGLNCYTLAYRDGIKLQSIHFAEIEAGKGKDKPASQYDHVIEVSSLQLSNEDKANSQMCTFLDKNSDLYIVLVNDYQKTNSRVFKLGSIIKDFKWHQEYNILATLNDNRSLSLWLYPYTVFIDSSLLQDTILTINNEQVTQNSRIVEFNKDQIRIERFDQVKISISMNAFITLLHKHRASGKWNEAIRICNFLEPVGNNIRNALWATLAVMTLESKEFQISEIAYASINKLDKVLYLNRIKSLPNKDAITAELEILCGNIKGAEHYLTQKGYYLRVILLNLELHQWIKALKLAEASNSKFAGIIVEKRESAIEDEMGKLNENMVDLINLVLSCRQHYLNSKNKKETIKEFQTFYNEVSPATLSIQKFR